MKKFAKFIFCITFIYLNSLKVEGSSIWLLDKELSEIKFELPVLLIENVKGEFKKIEGFVELDLENKENNSAFFSVKINSMEINYDKYKELLLSNIFFDELNFPYAIIETKKFTSPQNLNTFPVNAELKIKNITQFIPFTVEINHLANNLIQLKVNLRFSRGAYDIGKGKWSSTTILHDKIKIKANIFLNRGMEN